MATIKKREDLERWLNGHSREQAVAIAARAALRVAPLLGRGLGKDAEEARRALILPCFYAISASWARWMGSAPEAEHAAAARLAAAFAAAARADARADAAAAAAADAAAAAVYAAANAAAIYAAAVYADAADASWRAVSADCSVLEAGTSFRVLLTTPIWPKDAAPETIDAEWRKLKAHLLSAPEENWSAWIDWYERRLIGAPINESLEAERVLTVHREKLLDKAPAVVNARLLEVEEKHKAPPPAPPPPAPKAQPQILAPLQVEFRDGRVRRAPVSGPQLSAQRKAMMEGARKGLLSGVAGLEKMANVHNWPALAEMLQSYGGALNETPLDPVLLGFFGLRLNEYAQKGDAELAGTAAAELKALAAQHALFMRLFPEWAEFLKITAERAASAEDEQKGVDLAALAIDRIKQSARDLLDEDVQTIEGRLRAEAKPAPDAYNARPIALPEHRSGYLRSIANVLAGLADPAINHARKAGAAFEKGAEKAYEKQGEKLAAAALSGAGALLMSLAGLLPPDFAWILPVLTYLSKAEAPKDDDKE